MSRFYGVYPATVHDNSDPQGLLRLRLKVRMVLGDAVSDWAMPCLPTGWRDGVVKPHSDHSFTDANDGDNSSGDKAVALTHDHNHELIDRVPSLGSTVWVMFVAGDQDFPVWLGTT